MLSPFSKKDFTNTKWFIAEKIIQLSVGIFIIPKIFNSLGATDIGGLKYVESIIGMLSPLLFLGLAEISIREIIYKPTKTATVITTAFFLRIISWVVVISGLISYLFIVDETDLIWLYLIVSLSYLFRVTDVVEYYFQAVKSVKIIFISKISSLIIIALLQYYGVQQHLSVNYFAKLLAVDFLIQGAIYIFFISRRVQFKLSSLRFSATMAKYLLKLSFPLIISNLLVSFYITIDELFLKYYHGSEAVGVFSSVQFLVIVLTWNIGYSIINALYPSLAESYYLENKNEYYIKMLSLLKTLSVLGIIIGLFYTLFGDYILDMFFSESYSRAALPLKIFSWSPLVIFIGMVFEKHLINSNQLRKNVYRFALGIIVNLVLSYLLIPKWDVVGAAISVLVSHVVVNIVYVFFDSENRRQLMKIVSVNH